MKKKIIIVLIILAIILLFPIMKIYSNFKKENNVQNNSQNTEIKENEEQSKNDIKHSFVGTILEEDTTYMLIQPNEDEEERKLTEGYENFELRVKKSSKIKKVKILNAQELWKYEYDYNLYYYGLDEVNITIKNETMPLEKALRSGKMTLDGLIIKANKDFPNAISYDDGGSIEYHYKNYTIIKVHKLDGNRDVYIGISNMKLNDLNL